jgi:hypothetical protein
MPLPPFKRRLQMLTHLHRFNPESQDRISVLQRLFLRVSVVFLNPYRPGVFKLFAGAPLNKIYQFQCTTSIVLCFGQIKKLTLESLADSTDELNNADRNAVY